MVTATTKAPAKKRTAVKRPATATTRVAVKRAPATAKKKAAVKRSPATATKKAPVKRPATTQKKVAVKRAPRAKATAKQPETSNYFSNVFNEAWDQLDEWVDTAKLKAKELAAEEKLRRKKAELAVKTEIDHAKHLAEQTEQWMRARIKSDTKKINAYEKKLKKQLRDAEKKLKAQAKAAEKKAKKTGRELRKNIEGVTKKITSKAEAATSTKKSAPKRKAKASTKSK